MQAEGRRARGGGAAGFSLLEVMIVLAITLLLSGVVFTLTRSSLQAYRTLVHQTERGLSGLRALDDMAAEIARAGYGLRDDLAPLWPGRPGGLPSAEAITLRSNPAGTPGAEREVVFWLAEQDGAPVVARKATGQAQQVISRHVGGLRFDYVDEEGRLMPAAALVAGLPLAGVRVSLRLRPDPAQPPVSVAPLFVFVPLEAQQATVALALRGPVFHRLGVSAVVGQEAGGTGKKARLQAWKKSAFGG